MKKLLFILFCLISTTVVNAQIDGHVVDPQPQVTTCPMLTKEEGLMEQHFVFNSDDTRYEVTIKEYLLAPLKNCVEVISTKNTAGMIKNVVLPMSFRQFALAPEINEMQVTKLPGKLVIMYYFRGRKMIIEIG